ncbi:MAG: VanZ family protein [Gammaproteobacteria bacterium]|nr:VanZ family protein [Gammaproteobacteria bacterium]MDH5239235.1 VanZ family protein [Gammaproteobacteria bacterium]MDH5259900.1 VanZ family protein [Gammaproteobacteria bacterium]
MSVPIPVRWLLTLGLIVLIIVLSVTPGNAKEGDSGFVWLVAITPAIVQKVMHFVAYGVLATLGWWTAETIERDRYRALAVLLLCAGLGAVLEWYQTYVPGRFGSLTDILVNLVGALSALTTVVLRNSAR